MTWGILDNVAEALKIAPWELEEPGALGLDVPEAERYVLHCMMCCWSLYVGMMGRFWGMHPH